MLSLYVCLHYLDFYINGTIQYAHLFLFGFAFSIVTLKFIHAVYIDSLFFLMGSGTPVYGYTMICLSIHL